MSATAPPGNEASDDGDLGALKPADRTRGLLSNTAVLAFAQASSLLVSFLLTPYILETLGVEQYGLWAFGMSLVAFATLLQLGVGRGSVRFIALYSERHELDVVRRIVSYGVLSHLAAGIVLTPAAWLAARAVVPHLDIDPDLASTAETLFPLMLAYTCFAGAMHPFAALLIGLERMWITSIAMLISQLFYAAAVLALLAGGAGLYGLLAATWLQAAAQGVMYVLAGRHFVGRLVGNPLALDRKLVVEMIKFGGWLQGTRVMGLISQESDAVVIGSFLNVALVGLYDVGKRIALLIRMLPMTLLAPLLPTAAGIHAQGDEKRLARTILQASRLVGLIAIAAGGFVLATAPLIVTVWLGRQYPDVATIASVMVVAYVMNCLVGVGTTIVSAIGQPHYETKYAVISVALNIAATVSLAPIFGLYGILAGTLVGIVISTAYFLWRFHQVMGLPLRRYLGSWLWRVTAGSGAAALLVYAARVGLADVSTGGRVEGGLVLISLAILYALVLLLCLRTLRFFEPRDLATLQRVLPRRVSPLTRSPAVEFLFGARS
jgi:O-antigen/teichoic acid export membrane protein